MWDTLEKIEDELSKQFNCKVRFSKESFYSGEDRLFYKRITFDEKPTGVRVNIMDLQPGERRVSVKDKVASISKMLNNKGA